MTTGEAVTRRLAAILAADVAGYSRLMAVDEAGTLARFNALCAEVIEPKIAEFKGRVVGSAGDSLLVEFASASAAVTCAVEVQAKLAALNAELPEDRRMRFRMGINLGEVIADGATVHGDGVNVAARLEKLAEPGGVLIARAVHDQVKGKVALSFEDQGDKTLHNIAEPVRAYSVAVEDRGARAAAGIESPVKPSVAVLPFTNMSGDPEQDYFSDGITEDIITELSRFRELVVIARSSVFTFKGKAVRVQDVGSFLGAGFVVEGSVRKVKDRVRVTAQLVETAHGAHLWAERYDRPLEDIFAIQDEVTGIIASTVTGRVLSTSAERARRKPTSSLSAYECFIQAREYYAQQDATAAKAVGLLKKAIEIDPDFAQAHALLAASYLVDIGPEEPGFDRAMEHARRAHDLDPDEAWSHYALGKATMFAGSPGEAIVHFERALALNPNDTIIRTVYGGCLSYLDRHEEAIAAQGEALRRDPYPPDWYWGDRGLILMLAGRYREALVALAKRNEVVPWDFAYRAVCHAHLGELDQARASLARYRAHRPQATIAWCLSGYPLWTPVSKERVIQGLRLAGLPE